MALTLLNYFVFEVKVSFFQPCLWMFDADVLRSFLKGETVCVSRAAAILLVHAPMRQHVRQPLSLGQEAAVPLVLVDCFVVILLSRLANNLTNKANVAAVAQVVGENKKAQSSSSSSKTINNKNRKVIKKKER
jgi:hypothetical protein